MSHASAYLTSVQNGHEPLSTTLLTDRYPVYSVSRCRQAWDWMFQTLQTPAPGDWVRNEVTTSWKRCLEDYALTLPSPSLNIVHQGKYDDRLGRNTDLDLLGNILKNLAPQITTEADVALILADEHCVIQTMAESLHGGMLPMLCRQIGIDWSESVVGNNGIGTTALLSYPEAFAGEEHFSKSLHGFATAGFPIIRRDGCCVAIIGLVAAHTNDPLVLGSLARLLGLGVEHEFQKYLYPDHCHIKIEAALNHTGGDARYANRSGFVIVDQGMRIQAINSCVRILLGLSANGPIDEKRLDDYVRTECCNWFQQLVERKPVTALSGTGIQLRLSLDRLPAKLLSSGANRPILKKEKRVPSSLSLEQSIVSKLVRLQRHRVPILICGESGVGKEYLLKKAYAQSDRCHAPFIAVNCASMPRELIESELFGYEAGSFTGARSNGKPGKFMLADKGTLFLDEIGDMNLELQTTLLRVLESSEFYPIGGTRPVHVDVQVVAATNIDLSKAVESGKFRRDLYYRLNGAQIKVPPLRERDDKQLVIEQVFALVLQSLSMSQVSGLSSAELGLFLKHPWPGNVRELYNVLRQAVSMSDHDEIVLADLPDDFLAESESFGKAQVRSVNKPTVWRDDPLDRVGQGMTLAEWEKWGIERALQNNTGNICQTVRALGITRSTIYKKIAQYGIQR